MNRQTLTLTINIPNFKNSSDQTMRLLTRTFRSVKRPNPNPNFLKPSSSLSSEPSPIGESETKSKLKSWCVYLILSTNVPIKTYVGVTNDFSRRLKQHNGELKGGAKACHAGRPWICACVIGGFNDQSEGIFRATRVNATTAEGYSYIMMFDIWDQ